MWATVNKTGGTAAKINQRYCKLGKNEQRMNTDDDNIAERDRQEKSSDQRMRY